MEKREIVKLWNYSKRCKTIPYDEVLKNLKLN